MMRKILPILLAIVGLGGGIGGGLILRPSALAGAGNDDHGSEAAQSEADGHAVEPAEDHSAAADDAHSGEEMDEHGEGGPEYVKLNNQFVVPVVQDGRVHAMVVLAISLEVEAGKTELVFQREPKLRDALLQVMFDHANVGGFAGTFTDGSNLIVLRTNLKEAAAMILGTAVRDVLITDIARQDS